MYYLRRSNSMLLLKSIRSLATQTHSSNPQYTIRTLQKAINNSKSNPTSCSFTNDYLLNTYNDMGMPLFLQNTITSIFESSSLEDPGLNKLYEFTLNKLNELNFQLDNHNMSNRFETLINSIFQISLKLNIHSLAYLIISHIIDKSIKFPNDELNSRLIKSILTHTNLSLIIDIYSINRSQTRNIKEINEIFQLVHKYNKVSKIPYVYSDARIKSILDKSYYTLFRDVSTNTKPPYKTIENNSNPYSTLEMVIREFGSIISKRVSNSISFYKIEKSEEIDDVVSISKILDRQILSKYLQFCYFVIQYRCENNDPSSIFIIWKIIKPFHNKIYNSIIDSENNNLSNNFYYYQTLSKMITIFSKNKRYRTLVNELIYDLPLDSVKICPELMSSILYHCGRTKNENLGRIVGSRYDDESTISKNLNKFFGENGNLSILGNDTKFTPGQVHAFFSYNLRLGNKERSLEIVSYLRNKLIGFNEIDFNELVRSMLYNNTIKNSNIKASNPDLVWSMILENENDHKGHLNKYALTTYLDYLINQMNTKPLDFKRVDEVFKLAKKNTSKNYIKYWDYFFMSYFKYLNRKFPLEISQIVYINCKKFTLQKFNPKDKPIDQEMYFQKINDYSYLTNPFLTRYDDIRIKLSENIRMLILRDVYQRSDGYLKKAEKLQSNDLKEAREQFIKISKWVYFELMEIKETEYNNKNYSIVKNNQIVDLLKAINSNARKIGFKINAISTNKLNEDERKYRISQGENVVIDDITLEEEYDENLAESHAFGRKT